ncbi:hypothetical protein B0H19DRAFT_1180807 [Mycena capillaripes]|nr:hypothetical protein B0H19DRAFT_1180807 [Mycena capillaripes]
MERLPPELLLTIFAFACTDGGPTGCALSLVSRHVHNVSAPAKLRSVALRGLPRMRLFAAMLERNPTHPHVEHLFLTDNGGRKDLGENARDVYTAIITAVGPTLIALSMSLMFADVYIEHVVPAGCSLPKLRDLSMASSTFALNEGATAPSLPALRRLHLYGMSPSNTDAPLLDLAAAGAPGVTHMRLSCLYEFENFPDMLSVALGEQAKRSDVPKLSLPSALERLIVFACEFDYDEGVCGYGEDEQTIMMEGLEELAEKSEKITLGPGCWYDIDDCLEDWLDVVNGGDGCWRMPPRITKSTFQQQEEKAEQIRNGTYKRPSLSLFD